MAGLTTRVSTAPSSASTSSSTKTKKSARFSLSRGFSVFFWIILPRIVKIISGIIASAFFFFVLAMIFPLREELSGFYAIVDSVMYGFNRLCQFLVDFWNI